MSEEQNKEELILEAAREVFHKHGKAGARMQDIAQKAEINQALLHYYFRTKDKLFQKVFESDFKEMLRLGRENDPEKQDLFEFIRYLVRHMISFMSEHPRLPQFVYGELQQNPDRVLGLMQPVKDEAHEQLRIKLEQAKKSGSVQDISLEQLKANIFSLCIHPFMASAMICSSNSWSPEEFQSFIEDRKTQVADFIIQAIQK
jgi:AcrR family transcriptional regulator